MGKQENMENLNPTEEQTQGNVEETVTTEATTSEVDSEEWLKELTEKGYTTLVAGSREELTEMVALIPANVKYGAGAVGKDIESGLYHLKLELTGE